MTRLRAAIIVLGTVHCCIIFAGFVATKRLGLLPIPFLGLGILLPLLLQLSLGGYVHGSAVVMWAFMAPLFSQTLGQILLGVGGVMMTIGFFAIQKIVDIKV